MNRETKVDILTMIYQFVVCGTLFWFLVYSDFQVRLLGNVISSLNSIGLGFNIPLWYLITLIFSIIGVIGFYIQRKVHLKHELKKS